MDSVQKLDNQTVHYDTLNPVQQVNQSHNPNYLAGRQVSDHTHHSNSIGGAVGDAAEGMGEDPEACCALLMLIGKVLGVIGKGLLFLVHGCCALAEGCD